jgi:hypothetical protein
MDKLLREVVAAARANPDTHTQTLRPHRTENETASSMGVMHACAWSGVAAAWGRGALLCDLPGCAKTHTYSCTSSIRDSCRRAS